MIKVEHFFCWTMSARRGATVSLREEARLTNVELETLALQLIDEGSNSFCYLGTCHRIEFYAYGMDPYGLLDQWLELKNFPFKDSLTLLKGEEALRHLLRVECSLESGVIGETQVAGQVKDAFMQAKVKKHMKGPLERILQHSFSVAKKVRSQSLLGTGTVSVAHVAVDGLFDFYESLEGKNIVVVGAGPMAVQCVERVFKHKCKKITWLNRQPNKLKNFAISRFCQIGEIGDFENLINTNDVFIFATASEKYLLDKSQLKNLKDFSNTKVILDLALPRNVDPELRDYNGLYLRDVDDFQTRALQGEKRREEKLELAEKIIEEELEVLLLQALKWNQSDLWSQIYENIDKLLDDASQVDDGEYSKEISRSLRRFSAKLLQRTNNFLLRIDDDQAIEILTVLNEAWRDENGCQKKENDKKNKNFGEEEG